MEKFVTLTTGVQMAYAEQGNAAGTPIVFLHGVTDSWHAFEGVLQRLPREIHAFAISQRGHGNSSRPPSGYRFSDMSADLLAFLDAIGVNQAVIAGHSMGSSVAQRFAADHPDRLAGLVLMGAFANFEGPEMASFVASSIEPLTDPIDVAFIHEWQRSTLAREMSPAHFSTIVSETMKVPARVWRDAFHGFLATPDFTNDLRGVVVPTLLMWGEQDAYTSRAGQNRLLEVIPGARLITYEGHGHAFHWEDPDRATKDLVTFLSTGALA